MSKQKSIADALQAIKEETGFIYATLAKEVGLHATTIANYVKGKSIPSFETIEKLAKALKVKVEDIDESLRQPAKSTRPSVSKTRLKCVSRVVNDWLEQSQFSVSELAELAEIDVQSLRDVVREQSNLSDEETLKLAEAIGLDVDDLDPFFINGRKLDLGYIIHLNAKLLLAKSNLTANQIDKAMSEPVGTFYSAFFRKGQHGRYSIPRYDYIVKVADIFRMDPRELDPFTQPELF